jgi:hypothetical protein
MALVADTSRDGVKLADRLNTGTYKRVLLIFGHGIGDCCQGKIVLNKLREIYPNIHLDVGVFQGIQQEKVFTDGVFIDGDWRERYAEPDYKEYDLVYSWNFPMEHQHDLTKTKAEISCLEELGIPLATGYLPIKPKPLIGLHFNMTSIPEISNADEEVAHKIWDDVIAANCTPVETLFEHVFHNPVNKKYDFVDTHMRSCAPKLDTLISLIGSCYAMCCVVSGNFHLAMSILPSHRVMLLEKDLKREHFTKIPIATANLKNYQGEVKEWLLNITKNY